MGVRTIFNIMGPLTNPAGARRQILGVYDPHLTEPLAQVLRELGSERVFVVHGAGGLDELSTTGENRVSELVNGEIKTYTLNPAELGLKPSSADAIRGGDPAENATITRNILCGEGTPAQREIVLLNAGAALVAGGKVTDLSAGIMLAAEVIDSGSALGKLNDLVRHSQSVKVS